MRSLISVALLAAIHSAAAESPYSKYGRVIWYNPQALPLIRTADEVYILPVTLSDKNGEMNPPRGDYRHIRLLDADARRKLVRLLGKEENWLHASDNTLSEYARKDVGFIFRHGKDKLILLCSLGWRLEGNFNGEPTNGSLEEKPYEKLQKWKKRYAKPELGTK